MGVESIDILGEVRKMSLWRTFKLWIKQINWEVETKLEDEIKQQWMCLWMSKNKVAMKKKMFRSKYKLELKTKINKNLEELNVSVATEVWHQPVWSTQSHLKQLALWGSLFDH